MHIFKKAGLAVAMAVALSTSMSNTAFAYTECTGTIDKIFRGPDYPWVKLAGGGIALIYNADPTMTAYLSMLITAKAANMTVTIRFATNDFVMFRHQY